MDLSAELTHTLALVVDEIAGTAARLLAELESERDALLAGDDAALDAAGAAKDAHVRQLEMLEAERVHLAAQITGGGFGLAAMQAGLARDPATLARWRDTLELLARCRELNRQNGAVVDVKLRQVRQALHLLTGESPEPGLYGPRGDSAATRSPHTLAKA